MTTFAQHRTAFESFLDCVQGGAGKDAITGCLAENVVAEDEPLTARGRREAIQTVTRWRPTSPMRRSSAANHHAAFFG